MRSFILCLALVACGDDSDPAPADAGGTIRRDTGTSSTTDTGTTGGGSTVGNICANDTNCTGAGEVCCLESSPYVCQLATNCMETAGCLPCTESAGCPSSRICCRLGSDMCCMRNQDCTNLGGEPLP